ncbi:hypothetical protein [Sphingobium sp. B12D2B]|uniref:hypothetical protein n=1 Tax=Sphingobium sp. B12D2B TaxID=2940577 RepID=UPI0022243835|nr:hypothetical protein [Sphingobium sp. B12D2B]MCW2350738.1 hypothetical protein [Sphingobium sp. B12D2B]
MKSVNGKPASEFLDNRLAAAKELTEASNYTPALEIYEAIFKEGITAHRAFEGAGRAVTGALMDEALPTDWGRERLDDLLRILVLERDRDGTPPALCARIAAAHAGGNQGVLQKAAELLRPVLTALWDEGARDRGFLIAVLLLRHPLQGWQDEAAISRWHLDLLPQLDRHELSLPYNGMFDAVHFQGNIADLAGLAENTPPDALVRRFPAWQLLLFLWITGSRRADAQLAAWLAAYRSAYPGGATDEDDGAAARSLALRWAVSPDGPASAAAVTTALGPDLAALAQPGLKLRSTADRARSNAALARLDSRPWQAAAFVEDKVTGKAPFLKLGRRRPRIAVCVSGQLRGYRAAFPTWQASLLRDADCQFFIHSWSKIGRSGAEPFRAYLPFAGEAFCEAWRLHAGRIGMPGMAERYPALFAALADGGVVSKAELEAFYSTEHVVLEDDSDPDFAGWSNPRKMHYKLKAASDMATARGDEFDLILRIRPDKVIGAKAFRWGDALAACRATPTLLADAAMGHQYGSLMIGDQVALASAATMAVYADTLDIAPRFHEMALYDAKPDLMGHVSLAQTCWYAGITAARLPARMGKLMEAAPMASSAICAALEQDAAGRHDAVDKALLTAARTDRQRR